MSMQQVNSNPDSSWFSGTSARGIRNTVSFQLRHLRLLFAFSQGVEHCLENWKRIPRALFAKAWVRTGHITKEEMIAKGYVTEDEWEHCELLADPLGLRDLLGLGNAEEPSIEELLEGGKAKRQRVVWLIDTKGPKVEKAMLPASLLFPVERRLCHFLVHSGPGASDPVPPISSLVLSKRTGKELGPEMLKKHTRLLQNNTRDFRPDVPTRVQKDYGK